MSFDLQKFSQATFALRSRRVPIKESALQHFFGEGEPQEIELRQLDGIELSQCLDAERLNTDIQAVIGALIASESDEKARAIQDLLGIGGKVPNDVAKRIEMLTIGSVNPHFDREASIRICRFFPIEFYQWTNVIQNLSGAGAELGESKSSGAIPASGRRARSAGASGDRSMN